MNEESRENTSKRERESTRPPSLHEIIFDVEVSDSFTVDKPVYSSVLLYDLDVRTSPSFCFFGLLNALF